MHCSLKVIDQKLPKGYRETKDTLVFLDTLLSLEWGQMLGWLDKVVYLEERYLCFIINGDFPSRGIRDRTMDSGNYF